MTNEDGTKRVVVVTGGSRGIGRAVALRLAGPETTVCINYSGEDPAPAEEAAKQIEAAGANAYSGRVNVAATEEVRQCFNYIVKQWGRVDVLVNYAGVTADGLLVRMKEAD
jgi:3-oxoacyl-[acyl-carrier protein] reductase